MKMWAVVGRGEQGIIGIDEDFEMAWIKATRLEFDAECAGAAGMKEFLERQGCSCREVEVMEVKTP